MNTQPPHPGPSGSNSSWLAGTSSNVSRISTHQERRHQLIHSDAANAATENLTQDAHLKVVRKTGCSTNKKQHSVRCEYIHTVVNSRQLTIYHTAGVQQELCDQFIAARNEKSPWSTNAIICTVREIKYQDDLSPATFPDKFSERHPREWTKQAIFTLGEATEAYMVEVLAASHCLKHQLISCWNSTCLLWWQGREVVYIWNSPTCAWPWIWPKWPKAGFCAPQ